MITTEVSSTICVKGTLVDDRDGEIYRTVKIGNQIWMAENLRFVSMGGCADDGVNSFAYGEMDSNVETYGRLYTWEAVARGVAPEGWHVPCEKEWTELYDYLLEVMGAPGTVLKTRRLWREVYGTPVGTDTVGFGGVPSGGRYSMGFFHDLEHNAYYWTSDERTREYAMYRGLGSRSVDLISDYTYKTDALSIRCICDKNP